MLRIIALIIAALIITILYACCMAAHTSDEQMERMYQEYLDYKREKGADDE